MILNTGIYEMPTSKIIKIRNTDHVGGFSEIRFDGAIGKWWVKRKIGKKVHDLGKMNSLEDALVINEAFAISMEGA